MRRTNSRAGTVVLASLVLLAACGHGEGGDKSASPAEGKPAPGGGRTAEPVDPNKEAELTVYSMLSGNYEAFMDAEGQYIQRKYPNFKFKFIAPGTGTALKDVVAAKTPIDIIISTPDVQPIMDLGLDMDISDMVRAQHYDLNRFLPVTIDSMKQVTGGRLLGLPGRVSSYTLFYNKDLFDKFGVPYLNDSMTWEDILETARKLTRVEGGVQYYGFAGDIIAMLDMNEKAPQYVDPKTQQATLSTDYWKQKFDRIVPLYQLAANVEKPVQLTNITSAGNMFNKDKTVAISIGVNSVAGKAETDMKWDIVPFPAFKNFPKEGPQPSVRYYLISATSKYKEEAFAAITQFTSDDIQRELVTRGATPPLQNANYIHLLGSGLPELAGIHFQALVPKAFGEMSVKDQFYIQARAALINAFNQVVGGQKDVNTALREAEEAANKKIAELKSK
ncbi:extracellular solute-binding protein [Paenibacillus hemerocallicola]|uniref:Extracellular solute-binding protein n=1 Tax=Paenibacillus hemerocallicola TaxID=1172614 RepID=A0A5C4T3Q9_9BACL|nr:extracellular solute-binding protein [Paenibacillus hemerocallicola]TNJ63526.1 extracellular solute-binding protein [Paenibacillus hemerocallicola]